MLHDNHKSITGTHRLQFSLRSKRSRTTPTKFGPRKVGPHEKWGESKKVEGSGWLPSFPSPTPLLHLFAFARPEFRCPRKGTLATQDNSNEIIFHKKAKAISSVMLYQNRYLNYRNTTEDKSRWNVCQLKQVARDFQRTLNTAQS